jgi:hypothetical protein
MSSPDARLGDVEHPPPGRSEVDLLVAAVNAVVVAAVGLILGWLGKGGSTSSGLESIALRSVSIGWMSAWIGASSRSVPT